MRHISIFILLLPCILSAQAVSVSAGNSSACSFSTIAAAMETGCTANSFTVEDVSTGGLFIRYPGSDAADTAMVITVTGRKYKRAIDAGASLRPEWWGAVTGAQSGTYSAKKSVWVANWDALRKCATYALAHGNMPIMLSGTYEVYLSSGDDIVLSSASNVLIIQGNPSATLDIKPEVRHPGSLNMFKATADGALFRISNIKVNGIDSKWLMETYACNTQGSGLNRITFPGGTTLRSGFWAGINVGDFIAYQKADGSGYAETTIAAKDSATRTITLSGAVSWASLTSSYCFTYFPENTSSGTATAYGQTCYLNNDAGTVRFLNYTPGQANYTNNTGQIVISNVMLTNTGDGIVKSGGRPDLVVQSCYFSVNGVGVANFPGEYANQSKYIASDCIYESCGTVLFGNGFGDVNYGHDMYFHPNVTSFITREKHRMGVGSPMSYTSDSGTKPPPDFYRSSISDSYFENGIEPVRLGGSTYWDVKNCDFRTTAIQLGNDSHFNNCEFGRGISGGLQTLPFDNATTSFYRIGFDHCVFYDSSSIYAGWISGRTANTELNISNSTKYLGGLSTPFIQTETGGDANVYVNNVAVKSNTTYSTFQPFIDFSNPKDTFNINNLVYEVDFSGAASTCYFIKDYSYQTDNRLFVNNSVIKVKKFGIFDDGTAASNRVLLANTYLKTASTGGEPPSLLSFKPGVAIGSISSTTLTINSSADTYIIKDANAVIKTITPANTNAAIRGAKITLVAEQPFKLVRYKASGQTGSNISAATDTVSVAQYSSVTLLGNRMIVGATVYRDSILLGTGNGTNTIFSTGVTAILSGYARIPGTVRIRAGATSANGIDAYDNEITGTGITKAYAGYLHGLGYVKFTTAPALGVNVYLSYDRPTTLHQTLMWSIQ